MANRAFASERVRMGWTQAQTANELGCSVKSLAFYEKGVRKPPIDIVNKAADLFGCSTDYLLGRTDERLPKYALG